MNKKPVASITEHQKVFLPIVEAIHHITGLPVSIWVPDQERQSLRIAASIGLPEKYAQTAYLALSDSTIHGDAFKGGEIEVIEDINREARWKYKKTAQEMKWQSAISVPMKPDNQVIGIVSVYSFTGKGLYELVETVSEYANRAALSIRAERQRKVLEQLLKISSNLQSTSRDINATLKMIAKSACEVTGADCAIIYPYDQKRQEFYDKTNVASFGLKTSLTLIERPRRAKGTAAFIKQTRELVYSDIEKENREIANSSFIKREKIKAFMGVSLETSGEVLGVLYVDYRSIHRFSEDEKNVLRLFAQQASIAISNSRKVHRAEVLERFGIALTSGIRLEEDEILELIKDRAGELMDTSNMYIALYDQATDTVRFGLAIVDGKRVDVNIEKAWQPRKSGKGRTEEIIKNKKPILITTLEESEKWYKTPGRKEYIRQPFSSWLGVPMVIGKKVLGVVATYSRIKEHAYTGDSLVLLQGLANQAAITLQNSNLYEQAENRSELLERIRNITKAIASELDLQVCMDLILKEALKLFGAHYATIQFVDATTNELVMQARRGIEGKKLPAKLERIGIGTGITGEVVIQRETIRIGDVTKEKNYLRYIDDTHSEMAAPLFDRGQVVGVLNVEDPQKYAFNQEDQDLFELLAEEVVIAIQNARNVEREKESARFEYLGLLAGGLAHRVGSKTGLIRLHVNNLRRLISQDSKELTNIADKIERDNQYLIDLSDRLFGPARAKDAPITAIDINQLIREAKKQVGNTPGIKIKMRFGKTPKVSGNNWLIEVFVELITNAIKSMADSVERNITISTRHDDKAKIVIVTVDDTGCGIPELELQKVFNLFYSTGQDVTTPSKGGYGLWFCNTILTGIGGSIKIESHVEKGTKCIITLPIAQNRGKK